MADLIRLFVVDTSPLITLAAAQSLDYLLFAGAKIVIPDAVFYEATDDISRLGAPEIIEWAQANHERIEIAPTKQYRIFQLARNTDPSIKQPGLGEAATAEIINAPESWRRMSARFYYARKIPSSNAW